MILRPGASGFELASLFAVAGTLGFAGRDLATRAAPAGLSNAHLGLAGFAMLVVAGLIALPFGAPMKTPDAATTIDLAAATLVGVVAYQALTGAMRVGEISVVAPFRYTRLIFAMVLGVVVFQERPDMWTLIGSAVIVISGGFTLMRSNRRQVT